MTGAEYDVPPLSYPAGVDAARDRRLPHSAWSVYRYLGAHLCFTRYDSVKVWAVAHITGMDKETVGTALRLLVAHGYVALGEERHHGSCTYRLVWERTRE